MMRRLLSVLFLTVAMATGAQADDLQPLSSGQVDALLAPPAKGERIIVLWSLTCLYCEPTIAAVRQLQQRYPRRIELELVATNGPAKRDQVQARLKKMGVSGIRSRYYTEPVPQRLNYLIDPTWGGELPHTLVIHADGTRTAISGELTPAQIKRITP